MSFSDVLGQTAAVKVLSRALERGQVHHAYRFQGPSGTGKEKAALAFAAALLCELGETLGCDRCSSCLRARTLGTEAPHLPQHPDVVLLGKGLYSSSTLGTSKAVSSTSIGLAQVQKLIGERVPFGAHEGRALVFVIRDADLLSVSAANALLKTLEEPRPGVYFVLLTHRPERLLDTIRSRSLPIRFGPLPDSALQTILRANGLEATDLVLGLSGGSARQALQCAEPETANQRTEFLQAVEQLVAAADLGPALLFASALKLDRDQLASLVRALCQHYGQRVRQTVGHAPEQALRWARLAGEAHACLAALEGNSPPVLAFESLIARLRQVPSCPLRLQ